MVDVLVDSESGARIWCGSSKASWASYFGEAYVVSGTKPLPSAVTPLGMEHCAVDDMVSGPKSLPELCGSGGKGNMCFGSQAGPRRWLVGLP